MYTKPKLQSFRKSSLLGLCLITLFVNNSFSQTLTADPEQVENIPLDYFRIELILFRVLKDSDNGRLSNTISDYSDPVNLEEISNPDGTTVLGDSDLLDAAIEEPEILRSEVMENAWKRLAGSRNFRPLAYQQWDELRADTVSRHVPGGVEGAAIRVHAEDILPELIDKTSRVAEEPVQYMEENILEELIEPEPVYKLDGRATFGQGRFLHIKLDFEFRELNTAPVALLNQMHESIEEQAGKPLVIETDNPEAASLYTVFSLKKTRQIVPLKAELFDNEQFGMLIYLEEVSILEESAEEVVLNNGSSAVGNR